MLSARANRSPRIALISICLVVGVAGSIGFKNYRANAIKESSANYTITYPSAPDGWKKVRHSPQLLFAYKQDGTNLLLSGGTNQIVEEFNPTPDLDTESLAKDMMDVTTANMPGWTVEKLDTVEAKGTTFRLIRRAEKGHVVIDAFAVRGNTTILLTLTGRNSHTEEVNKNLGRFRDFLSSVKLTQADLTNL